MRFLFKVLGIFFLFVLVVNLGFWALVGLRFGPVSELYWDGLVVKIEPLGRAYVFAHGGYDYGWEWNESGNGWGVDIVRGKGTCIHDAPVYHKMRLNGNQHSTISFVEDLRGQGYDYVWGSWCYSGDHPYIIRYANGSVVPWPDWVSRNERPGITIPVFWGLGFFLV